VKKPYIVISNDDGISAKGFSALYSGLPPGCEVLAIAPDTKKSGASHSVTLDGPLSVEEIKFMGISACKVKGTPADCVKIAMSNFVRRQPDLVISGVNHGPNTASNILYSGTIGAAAEAAILGIPALAFSLYSYDEDADFTFTKGLIRWIVGLVLKKRIIIRKYGLLNVNIPYLKQSLIKGIKILPAGAYIYNEKYRQSGKGRVRNYYLYSKGKREIRQDNHVMTDAHAVEQGYVAITPLQFDLTDNKSIKSLIKKIKNIKKNNKKGIF